MSGLPKSIAAQVAGQFDPRPIGNVACWFDPFDRSQLVFSASDTAVSEFKNKGTNFVPSAFQGTGASQPAWGARSINSAFPGLSYDSGDFMDIADHAGFDNTTQEGFIITSRTTDVGGTQGIFGKGGGFGITTENALIVSGGDKAQFQATTNGIAAGATVIEESGSSVLGTTYLYNFYYDGTNIGLSVNGGAFVTGALASMYNGTAICQLGRTYGASFSGVLGDVIMFTKVLTVPQRMWMRQQLAKRVNLILAK